MTEVAVIVAILGVVLLNYQILRKVTLTAEKVKSLPCVTGHVVVDENGNLRLLEDGPRKLPMFNSISNDINIKYDFNGGKPIMGE